MNRDKSKRRWGRGSLSYSGPIFYSMPPSPVPDTQGTVLRSQWATCWEVTFPFTHTPYLQKGDKFMQD